MMEVEFTVTDIFQLDFKLHSSSNLLITCMDFTLKTPLVAKIKMEKSHTPTSG